MFQRRLDADLSGRRHSLLAGLYLPEDAQHPLALRRREMIDEQHPIQMIKLMEKEPGVQPFGLEHVPAAVAVLVLHPHGLGPRNLRPNPRKGEAALLLHHELLGAPEDAGVEEHDGVSVLLQAHHGGAQGEPDLVGG